MDDLAGARLTVLEGKDGWLFLDRFEDLEVMRYFTDASHVNEHSLSNWARNLERRWQWFAQRNISCATIFVPEACTIYPDMLPDGMAPSAPSPYERLLQKLSPEVASELVYPKQVLINGRNRFETYQKVDSHWTDWGGYLGYRALMERVRKLVPNVRIISTEEITWVERRTFGALGPLMTPERSCRVPIPRIAGDTSRTVENIITERRDAIHTVVCDDSSLPTALVFRDSFTTAMAPFLQSSFSRTVYATAHAMHFDLIEELKPDIVIYERAERALYYSSEEPSHLDARALFGDLRLGSEQAMAAQRSSRSMLGAGNAAEALNMSDHALLLASPDASGRGRAYVHRATVYEALGNTPAAMECLSHAATLEPGAAFPLMAAGEIERRVGRNDQAVALLQRAAELEPLIPHYWDLLAGALLRQGNISSSKDCIERSLVLDDSRHAPQLLLTQILCALGEMEEAHKRALAAISADDCSLYTFSTVASALIQSGHWVAAIEVLQRAIQQYPGEGDFLPYLQLCEARIEEQKNLAASDVG